MSPLYLRISFYQLIVTSFLFSLSCTRIPPLFTLSLGSRTLDHNFKQGTADDLYRRSDLIKRVFTPSIQPVSEENSKDSASKDRQKKYPDLYKKSDSKSGAVSLDSLLKIRTGPSKGEKGIVSFAQENIRIDLATSFINEYEFLDYEVISPKTKWQKNIKKLLGRVEKFKGFPETEYYILPKQEGNFLILYKLAKEEHIPYDELPLAKTLGDLLAVPLIGYPVENCLAEIIPDKNNRETGQFRPRCEGIRKGDYIRLKEKSKKLFKYEEKLDLFPRNFFSGQWFYHRTVVRSPENRHVGHPLFDSANLVEFHPGIGKLNVLDAGGYKIEQKDKVPALFIPVDWADYQIKRDSENLDSSFSEEVITKVYDTSLRYLKVKFKELVENQIPQYQGEKTLKDVFITDDYLSFNIEVTKKDAKGAYLLKYAFRKKLPAKQTEEYIEKQWFEDDSTLFFPAFFEERRYYDSSLDHTQADNDRFLRTTRFNPKSRVIRWYFSRQTPHTKDKPELAWIRELGRKAVFLINQAFQEANKCPSEEDKNKKCSSHSIKIVLDETEDREVGDLRYNILNLMFTEGRQTSGLLGLGPNVADPTTGEVISATANVWVNHTLSIYIPLVRRYIRFQVYPPSWKLNPYVKGKSMTPFLHEKIQNEKDCKAVRDFITNKNGNRKFDRDNPDLYDKEIIKMCASALARSVVLGVILHEMLHGFANRHIFSASVDRENFYKSYDEIKSIFGADIFIDATESHPHPPQYSSVMDYMSLNYPVLSVPGKLDIAALRFIYFDHVELKKGGFLKVPAGVDEADSQNSQKSILQVVNDSGLRKDDLKPYEVLCGGKKIEGKKDEELDPNEPLCVRFDYGATPLEVVQNSMIITDNYLSTERNRYDSKKKEWKKPIAMGLLRQVKHLYKKWEKLRDDLLGLNDKTLFDYSFLNSSHVEEYKRILKEEASKNAHFQSYYEIRRPVFDYIMKLVFLPLKHCVYKDSDGAYSAVALENIESELVGDFVNYPDDTAEFASCKSPVVQQWQKDKTKGELVAEVGFFGTDRKYVLRPQIEDLDDETSAFRDLMDVVMNELFDGFFDIAVDPEFADLYYKKMSDYVFKGLNLNPYIDRTKNPDIPRDKDGNPKLPPVLNYKIDTAVLQKIRGKGQAEKEVSIYEWRQQPLHFAVNSFKEQAKKNVKRGIHVHFDTDLMELIDISQFAESVENSIGVYESDYPFFSEIWKEYVNPSFERDLSEERLCPYEKKSDEISTDTTFSEFIKKHPAILNVKGQGFFIPYTVKGFPARLFRKYNQFAECLKRDKLGCTCSDKQEKKAFLNIVSDKYYQSWEEFNQAR